MRSKGKLWCCCLLAMFLFGSEAVTGETVEGFDRQLPVKASNTEPYMSFTQALVKSYWEYPSNGNELVEWSSESATDRDAVFLVPCGLGSSKGEGNWHSLEMNGKHVLDFNAVLRETARWEGPGGAAEFSGLHVDSNGDMFGIMRILPHADLVESGKPQVFRVTGKPNRGKGWFMLSSLGDLHNVNVNKMQEENKVTLKIESFVRAAKANAEKEKQRQEHLQLGFTRWPGAKDAALSLAAQAVSAKGVVALNFFAQGKQLPEAANAAVDEALTKGAWLNEIWPEELQDGEVFKLHQKYLQDLACVLWRTDAEAISAYLRYTATIKVEQEELGGGRIRVAVKRKDAAVSAVAITVEIDLLPGTWEAWVETKDGRKIPAEYTVVENKRKIRFDFTPNQKEVFVICKVDAQQKGDAK
jgi:hypothetical protein